MGVSESVCMRENERARETDRERQRVSERERERELANKSVLAASVGNIVPHLEGREEGWEEC